MESKKPSSNLEVATLAGGCFWGMEDLFRRVPGVVQSDVGYSRGALETAKYEFVKQGTTGHAEALQITFDPAQVSYEQVLDFFFRIHDPTTLNQQGNDIGSQYRSVIFAHNDDQKRIAQEMIERVNRSGSWEKPVITAIESFKAFYPAETYHQDYLMKNPGGYTCHFVRRMPSFLK